MSFSRTNLQKNILIVTFLKYFVSKTKIGGTMLKNYIKIAFRNLFRNKFFSFISIAGLAAGMSVCLLIIIFGRQLLSYDNFHEKSDRIFHVYSDYKVEINPDSHLYGTTPYNLGFALKDETPEVKDFTTLNRYSGNIIKGENKFEIYGFYASHSFFNLFDFKFINGNPQTALEKPNSIVITEETAERIFGNKNVIGSTLIVEKVGEFSITGIIEKPTSPTMIDFEVLLSYDVLNPGMLYEDQKADWNRNIRDFYTFVLLKDGVSVSNFTNNFNRIIKKYYPAGAEAWLSAFKVQNIRDISTGPFLDNQIKFFIPAIAVYVLGGLAAIILFAATFNYVGLSVARALKRSREVGVRKVIGAIRSQILTQFLIEAIIVSLISLLFAVFILTFLVNGFNNLTPIIITKSQVHPQLNDITLYAVFIFFTLLVGVLSGLYPAIYLSRFLPVAVLKGITKMGNKGFTLRKVLITTQFGFSLLFIISTIMLYKQSESAAKTNYGFNETNIVNVELNDIPYKEFRAELMRSPGITNVSAVSTLTGSSGRNDTWIKTDNLDEHEKGYSLWIDENFLTNLQIQIIAGRNYLGTANSNIELECLLNESAVKRLELGSPQEAVGQIITIDDTTNVQVIGVVKDFIFFSALSKIDPLVLRINNDFLEHANIKFASGSYEEITNLIISAWKQFSPSTLPNYKLYKYYLADAIELKLMKDFLNIISLASAFAILISCLGLIGMTSFITETRLREIGIRKVLGASTKSVVNLLSLGFVKMIFIAVSIASPLAWFINNLWLEEIGNRIEFNGSEFLLSIFFLLLIALATIGSQTFKAARTNPVEIIKYE